MLSFFLEDWTGQVAGRMQGVVRGLLYVLCWL